MSWQIYGKIAEKIVAEELCNDLFCAIFKIEPTSVHFLHGNHQILISHDRHFVAEKKGGGGAVRQITEFILNARGDWDKIVNSYLQEGQGDAQ